MPGSASANASRVPEGTYPTVPLSIFKHLHQKQDLLELASDVSGCNRGPGKVERPLCDNFPDADLDRAFVPSDHEERTGSIQDRGNFHNPEDTLRLKGSELHLRNGGTLLRGVDSLE